MHSNRSEYPLTMHMQTAGVDIRHVENSVDNVQNSCEIRLKTACHNS